MEREWSRLIYSCNSLSAFDQSPVHVKKKSSLLSWILLYYYALSENWVLGDGKKKLTFKQWMTYWCIQPEMGLSGGGHTVTSFEIPIHHFTVKKCVRSYCSFHGRNVTTSKPVQRPYTSILPALLRVKVASTGLAFRTLYADVPIKLQDASVIVTYKYKLCNFLIIFFFFSRMKMVYLEKKTTQTL